MTLYHTPICGTLAYLWDRERDQVLLVHRNARSDDEQFGYYNGLGGKLEAGESVVDNLRRELREEASIEVLSSRMRGTIAWPGFGPNGEDWLGFIFVVESWTGTIPKRNVEGDLAWVERSALMGPDLKMFPGDRYFLPLVFDDDVRQFHGVMPYRDGQPTGWTYERL